MSIALPRFGAQPYQLMATPASLQAAIDAEYGRLTFRPITEAVNADADYGAAVVDGISSVDEPAPRIDCASISDELMDLAFSQLTPLIEDWAGCRLVRSWGYGIRSYGPGSVLHVHRDRVDTHVVSCILHVADRSVRPWPLDFISHEGDRHAVFFDAGSMLFYESLCPHGRTQPFRGDYYRNMYFHWRPLDWDPVSYRSMRCKFASLDEAQQDCQRLARAQLVASVPEDWQDWLRLNLARGCAREGMVEKAEIEAGLARDAIEAVLDQPPDAKASTASAAPLDAADAPTWLDWFAAPLTRQDFQPRAWRLDTPLAQIYELPDFISRQDCEELMSAIDRCLVPSTVTRGDSSYRTSRTSHLGGVDADLVTRLEQRLVALFGVERSFSEPLQGQRYDVGQCFKEHTDWFEPGTNEFASHTNPGGQRTWTVMIYLNTVDRGGQTCFKRLGRCYAPIQGMALAWNNLMAEGTPNPYTLHEAMPVQIGSKWVVTKWFRARKGRII
jgi:prolyl 4-hydroxylase